MRLGKEQAAGYVEDTGVDNPVPVGETVPDPVLAEEVTMDQPQRTPLTPAPELILPADFR